MTRKNQKISPLLKTKNPSARKQPLNQIKLKQFINLQYALTIETDEEDNEIYYIARIPELIGLIGTGGTIEEAKADIEEAKADYIKALMKMNIPIPLPHPSEVTFTIFETGHLPASRQVSQLGETITLNFDLSEKQELIGTQPKEFSAGIFWPDISTQGSVEVNSSSVGQSDYKTSVPVTVSTPTLIKTS